MRDDSFLGKASLLTLLGGLGVWAIGLLSDQDEVAMVVLVLAIVVSFVLGIAARREKIAKVSLVLSGGLIVLAAANYVMFILAAGRL